MELRRPVTTDVVPIRDLFPITSKWQQKKKHFAAPERRMHVA
jgi:hypothetical protein